MQNKKVKYKKLDIFPKGWTKKEEGLLPNHSTMKLKKDTGIVFTRQNVFPKERTGVGFVVREVNGDPERIIFYIDPESQVVYIPKEAKNKNKSVKKLYGSIHNVDIERYCISQGFEYKKGIQFTKPLGKPTPLYMLKYQRRGNERDIAL